jgi:hypothetical protein
MRPSDKNRGRDVSKADSIDVPIGMTELTDDASGSTGSYP